MKLHSTPKTKITLKAFVDMPSPSKTSIGKFQTKIEFKRSLKPLNSDLITHPRKSSQNKTQIIEMSHLSSKSQLLQKLPKFAPNRSQNIKGLTADRSQSIKGIQMIDNSPNRKIKHPVIHPISRVKTPAPQRPKIAPQIQLTARPKTALKQATTTKLIVHKFTPQVQDFQPVGVSRPKSSLHLNSSRFGAELPVRPQTQISINSDLAHICLPANAPRKRRQPSQTLKKEKNNQTPTSHRSQAERSGSLRRVAAKQIHPPNQTPNRLIKIIENPTLTNLSTFLSQPCQLGPKPRLAKLAQVKKHSKLKDLPMPPLHLACHAQDAKLVEKLVRKERQPVDQIFNSETALHVACRLRSVEVVEKLLLARASTEISDGNGDTILHLMAKHNNQSDSQDLWDLVVPFCSQILTVKNKQGLTVQQILARQGQNTPDALKKEGCLRAPTNKFMRTEIYSEQSDDCVSESRSYSPTIQFNITDRPHTSLKTTKQPTLVLKKSPSAKVTTDYFVAHQLLGAGSFGEVFLVERKSDKKLLAMKVLSKKKVKEQGLEKYTYTERNIMSTMNHPFIVPLLYAFQTKEKLFLVSEYCSGGDLSQYLQIEGKFTEEIAKLYISEVLVALEALHQKNVLYRDLKPDNIVLDEKGHVLITDFGLSREGVYAGDLGAGSFCGSYAYLSPEIVQKKVHGKSVDCYMLGVLLHEMLFGLPPFYDDDKDQLFNNILNQKFKIDRNINFISVQAEDLLSRLLERDPKKRIGAQSIEEVKYHSFFNGTNWEDVLERKLNMPYPYLSDLASKIVKEQPYLVAGHPSTVGNPCPQMSPLYYKNWSFYQ